MSARDAINGWMADVQHGFRDRDIEAKTDKLLSALHAAGYRLIEPGELDRETIERCAEVAKNTFTHGLPGGTAEVIAAALRSLREASDA